MQTTDLATGLELSDLFRDAPVAVISDNLDRLPGFLDMRPYHRGGRLVGPARTVRTRPGDNLMIHKVLDLVRPGEVIVVAGEGDTTRALIGEIIVRIAQMRGVAGFVVDGAIRDLGTISAGTFPCFARGVIHRGPYKDGPGEIDVPIAMSGGTVVSPGDIVVGDEDGVVSFPQSRARDLAEKVKAHLAKEEQILQSIDAGKYTGAYGKK
jgi:regulator of RNase E activity RraA